MNRVVAVVVIVCLALALVWLGALVLGDRPGDSRRPNDVEAGPDASDDSSHGASDGAGSGLTPEQRQELDRLATLGYIAGKEPTPDETGLLRFDRQRSYEGYTLFTCAQGAEAFLIDMEGNVVHEWRHPGSEYWARAHVMPNGDLLAMTSRPYRLMKLDSESRLVWRFERTAHHDFEVQDDGTIVALVREAVSVPQVHGGQYVLDDNVVTLSQDGLELSSVSLLSAFESSDEYGDWLTTRGLPDPPDIFHTNSVQVVERGGRRQALLSVRAIDTVTLVDLESGKVVWAATGPWRRQHEAMFVGDNLLLFDNLGAGETSRVLELEFPSLEQVWSYTEDGFHSEGAGSQQRLPNGNTLIVESDAGRIIEVTESGDVVWEYVNPRSVMRGDKELVLGFMRAERIPADFPMAWAR